MSATTSSIGTKRKNPVCRQFLQPLTVGIPGSVAIDGYGQFPIEFYSLGRGVTAIGQRCDLPSRQGTLELEAPRMFLVFDMDACKRIHGFVVPVKGNIRSIFKALKAKHQAGTQEFLFTRSSHTPTSQKTVILHLPQAMGKTTIGNQLAEWLGCTTVVDSWTAQTALTPGALHLTNTSMELVGGAA
jgi:hypothetical protein